MPFAVRALRVRGARLDWSLPRSLQAGGHHRPAGQWHAESVDLLLDAAGSARGGIARIVLDAADLTAPSGTGPTGSLALGPASLALRELRWRADGERSALTTTGSTIEALASRATLTAALDRAVGGDAHGAIDLDAHVALRPLMALGWLPGSLASASGAASFVVRARGERLSLAAPDRAHVTVSAALRGEGLRVAGLPLASARASLSGERGHVALSEFDVAFAGSLGRVRAQGGAAVTVADPPGVGAHWLGLEASGLQTRRLVALVPALRALAQRNQWLPAFVEAFAHVQGERGWPRPTTALGAYVRTSAIEPVRAPVAVRLQAELTPERLNVLNLSGELGTEGTLQASGEVALTGAQAMHGTLRLDATSLARLLVTAAAPVVGEHAHLVLALDGDRAVPVVSGRLSADGLRLREGGGRKRLGALSVPFQLRGTTVRIAGATLRGPNGGGRLEVLATVSPGHAAAKPGALPFAGELDAELRLDHVLIPLGGGGYGRAEGSASVSGPWASPLAAASLHLYAPRGPAGQPVEAGLLLDASRLEAQLVGLAVRLGQNGLLRASARYLAPRGANPPSAPAPPGLPVGEVVACLQGRGLPLPTARGAAPVREVAVSFDASLNGNLQRTLAARFNVQSPQGWLVGHGDWQPPAPGQAAYAAIAGELAGQLRLAPLGRMLPALSALRPGGTLALRVTAAPGTTLPVLDGKAAWRAPRLAGQEVRAGELTLALHGAGESLTATLDASRAQSLRARASWRLPQRGPSSAEVWLEALELADLYPPFHASEVSVAVGGHAIAAREADGWHAEATLARLQAHAGGLDLDLTRPATLVWGAQSMRLDSLQLSGSAGRISARASMGTELDAAAAANMELAFALPFLPALRHAEGGIALSLAARGNPGAPRTTARLDVTRPLAIAPQGVPSELQISQGHLVLREEVVTLSEVAGQLDGGSFTLDGTLFVPDFRPDDFTLSLRASHLPLQAGPLVMESNVALDVRGNGQGPRALVRGDVDILGGRFLRKFELRDFNFLARKPNLAAPLEQRMPWLSDVALDVRAKNKSGFDVRVDAGTFAMASTLESDVHIGGNALNPIVNGKIAATEGALHFPHGTLTLHQANLDFDPSRRTKANALGAEVSLLADGEIAPLQGSAGQTYDVTLRLDGDLENLVLDLGSAQGLGKMAVLALLTTGHADITDLTQSGDEMAKLDAAIAFAGSQVAEPIAQFAQRVLERRLNVAVELGTEVTQGNVRVTAAKNLNRRLRLETAYSHGIAAEQSNVSTRAQLAVTDRLMLEGRAARDLTGSSATTSASDHGVQSNLELKLRLLGH